MFRMRSAYHRSRPRRFNIFTRRGGKLCCVVCLLCAFLLEHHCDVGDGGGGEDGVCEMSFVSLLVLFVCMLEFFWLPEKCRKENVTAAGVHCELTCDTGRQESAFFSSFA